MRVASIQLNSGRDVDQNLNRVDHLLAEAAQLRAELAVLPENFAFMGGSEDDKRNAAEEQDNSPIIKHLSAQAKKHGMAIIGGTLLLKGEKGRLRNSSPAFDQDGRLLAVYDKIHLFDMDYQGEAYRESALIEPGSRSVVVDFDKWRIGLSICYDLRFPELYRLHASADCHILCNVAAFTAVTGSAHWEPLLRARAIENQCYVIASAQTGLHADGRQTWGHSMIIDPWGQIMVSLSEGEGVITADLSLEEVHRVRKSMPVLQHRRL
ncbi:nitrilase [Mariprofundus ferrinatatus]|uniref:Nitrilase n=1 Tax=Mariprofundus ferrinatatus TaxID=1921087 RepID=A0A2K8L2W3_9PROT|nr:carbon-nitrogen hydrolase family protein [Mariprofundus ferrinatatus]ATX81668.1 nitrilase [Mariprofundus ferrinatatus]